mmetsp:Transcript_1570/g.4651  ORF Transcript_1570/g.4651 Transcript_1570/m.4651 type:complete len:200 (+) Transcript_1570:254-853(+)
MSQPRWLPSLCYRLAPPTPARGQRGRRRPGPVWRPCWGSPFCCPPCAPACLPLKHRTRTRTWAWFHGLPCDCWRQYWRLAFRMLRYRLGERPRLWCRWRTPGKQRPEQLPPSASVLQRGPRGLIWWWSWQLWRAATAPITRRRRRRHGRWQLCLQSPLLAASLRRLGLHMQTASPRLCWVLQSVRTSRRLGMQRQRYSM